MRRAQSVSGKYGDPVYRMRRVFFFLYPTLSYFAIFSAGIAVLGAPRGCPVKLKIRIDPHFPALLNNQPIALQESHIGTVTS